ncbi:MAG: vitamin K-dependent gamma-carboxylase [Bacteroidia bacterium]|jgi:vitamin K-dependent gamma-carboxylase
MSLQQALYRPIDHVQITIWRILFGLVLVFECFGSNLVGWTNEVFVSPPEFTFSFIGFEWLQPLPGNGMYYYFFVMGIIAIAITIGWRYRLMMALFTVGWAGLYFMHKTSYNNHHYLMLLLCIMMCFTPAHVNQSRDAKAGRTTRLKTIPAIYLLQFLALFIIVYTYASVAKWYPDWASGRVSEIMLGPKSNIPIIGKMYTWKLTPVVVGWGGILYDLLVIPALLWKPTRKIALVISIGFHLFNSITFQIGTFPYMMIGASVLFFPPATIRKLFRVKVREPEEEFTPYAPKIQRLGTIVFVCFMALQVVLPLRHLTIPGNVFYTEEGHRLSWRMMLRVKYGTIKYRILKNGKQIGHEPKMHLTKEQYNTMATHPDMIWQYCQFIKTLYGDDIEIYVNAMVSINHRKYQPTIDPSVDMAKVDWHTFGHEDWILLSDWQNEKQL